MKSLGAKLKSPCFKCKERFVGCHSKCERYKKYRSEYDKLNKKEKREKMLSYGTTISLFKYEGKTKF